MPRPPTLASNPKLALFALAATATSGFGQTFFVAVFGGEIREAFVLSNTAYGSLYSAATLCSAILLLTFGSLVDRWSLVKVTALAVLILAGGCLLIGVSTGVVFLGLGFILVRFGGQGMSSHIGMTTAARYFPSQRGRAVALASAGFPLAEAALPATAALLVLWMNWRLPWVAGAVFLVLVVLPLLAFLSWNDPAAAEVLGEDRSTSRPAPTRKDFNRSQVLRDPGFYLILPATLVTPFVVTALFFHQVALASELAWSLEMLAVGFSVYAACHLGALAAAGPVVDRIGAGIALPLALLPIIVGLLVLALLPTASALYIYFAMVGATQGLAATATGSIWAERYGILHLGALRSMNQAIMVIATAIAPVLLGLLLDRGVSVASLAVGLALGAGAASSLARLGASRDAREDA